MAASSIRACMAEDSWLPSGARAERDSLGALFSLCPGWLRCRPLLVTGSRLRFFMEKIHRWARTGFSLHQKLIRHFVHGCATFTCLVRIEIMF